MHTVAAKVSCRLNVRAVDLGHSRVYRHYHIGQVIVYHTEYNGTRGVYHLDRVKSEVTENRVYNSRILEYRHPGISADEQIHPHGEHDEHYQHPLCAYLHLRNEVRKRISYEKADKGGYDGKADRTNEHLYVVRVEHLSEVYHRKRPGLVCEGIVSHKQKRSYYKQHSPYDVRGCRQFSECSGSFVHFCFIPPRNRKVIFARLLLLLPLLQAQGRRACPSRLRRWNSHRTFPSILIFSLCV